MAKDEGTMLRIVSDGLWGDSKKLGTKNKPRFAAVAYVTSDAHLKFGRGDTLVCDASDQAISSGQTSASVLRAACARGAKVYSSPGLHAKAIVLGRMAVVGSANMSASSASTLDEAALITDDARAVVGVRVLVEQLAKGGNRVDDEFLARILKIKVRVARHGSRRRRAVKVRGPRAWLISVVPLDDDKHADENDVVESERGKAEEGTEISDSDAGYVRWVGNSTFRKDAKPGDLVITIWKSHSKSKGGTVYAPEPLLHRKDNGKVTHLFVEEYADRDETSIPFSAFSALWRRVGSGRAPTINSTREVPVDVAEALRASWKK